MQNDTQEVDYIVVGGGASGCVIAARLSEDLAVTVALLEAGGRNDGPEVGIPGNAFGLLQGDTVWPTTTIPQQHAGGREVPLLTGRGLGGGSAVNAMGWFQGMPEDYDAWEADGATGWSWSDVQPIFRAIEDHELGSSEFHGAGGPMAVSAPRHVHPLSMVFLRAGKEMGWPVSADLNGSQRVGVSLAPSNIRDGARHSVVDGYLREASTRPNLDVITNAHVRRIMLKNGVAIGVDYHDGSSTPTGRSMMARKGVILCAGAIRTPQLLLLSGIGPAADLADYGIEPLVDSPEVGRNLQDHPAVSLAFSLREIERLRDLSYERPEEFYSLQRRGPLSALGQGVAALPVVGEMRSSSARPDFHLGFAPLGTDAGLPASEPPTVFCQVSLVRVESRGRVLLSSKDPDSAPLVDPSYLSVPEDRNRLRLAVRMAFDLFDTEALSEFIEAALTPLISRDDASIDAFIDQGLITYHHPVGTARIGTGNRAVVDSRLHVHGVERLWIADASVMPRIPRANAQASTVMIAERAAGMIVTGGF